MGRLAEEVESSILEDVKKKGVKFISLQFVDIPGTGKACEISAERLEGVLHEGLWFDGSSIEGFVRIHESDMFLKPDPETYAILPWTKNKVAKIMCDVYVDEKTPFEGCPRYALKKILKEAGKKGYDFKVGPEVEFFLFKEEGERRIIPRVHDAASYFDLAPKDLDVEMKREIVTYLNTLGMDIEMSHHEVAPGQHEIDFRYDNALKIADDVLTYKNAIKTVAKNYGLFASFMPKPIFGVNGSGMHIHQSLWRRGENAFFDERDEYHLSDVAKSFIAGQLHHARGYSAVVAPIVNSYKRLVPGYEAPVYICWARINRSALIRVPRTTTARGKRGARIELRCPDPSCNPYLAFTAMLGAGLDGVNRKMEPPEPVEEDVYQFDDRKLAKYYIKTLPSSLKEAVEELEKDEVVRKALGNHIAKKLIETQRSQWDEYKIHVTPWELDTYLPVT